MFYDSSFVFTATAYRSEEFWALFSTPTPLQPSPPILFIYVVAANAISFEKLFHDSYSLRTVRSSRHLCCKIFMLKYFCRTSTLRKYFNTKIFPAKISYNENFPIYGIPCYCMAHWWLLWLWDRTIVLVIMHHQKLAVPVMILSQAATMYFALSVVTGDGQYYK